MKVAISGSHGVGKSTLAGKLVSIFPYPYITEVARRVIPKYSDTSKSLVSGSHVFDCQIEIFFTQLSEEAKHTSFISDRSILDVIAYSYLYDLHNTHPETITYLKKLAIDHTSNYDLIVYCPIPNNSGPVDDGFRLTDKESQIKIANLLENDLLPYAKCTVLYLPTDRAAWAGIVREYIVTHCHHRWEKKELDPALRAISSRIPPVYCVCSDCGLEAYYSPGVGWYER